VAIDKPASIPVHPCGNFKYNSVMSIMEIEKGFKQLNTVHRLDRQTSGILFYAKNEETAREFTRAMTDNLVEKVYYARVVGNFLETQGKEEITVDKWVYIVANVD
jgi:tRNA pseudouridine synthase 9